MNGILKYFCDGELVKIVSFTHFTISNSMNKIFLYRSDNLEGDVIPFMNFDMDITRNGFVIIIAHHPVIKRIK